MPYGDEREGIVSVLQPTSTKPYTSLHLDLRPRDPIVSFGNTLPSVVESRNFLGMWWDSHLSFKKHISVPKTQCKEVPNFIQVVTHLKWGGDGDTLLMLYRANVRSKFAYGCIVYDAALNINLLQLEDNEAPLKGSRLKLSMHYYMKTRACNDNPAHHAPH